MIDSYEYPMNSQLEHKALHVEQHFPVFSTLGNTQEGTTTICSPGSDAVVNSFKNRGQTGGD